MAELSRAKSEQRTGIRAELVGLASQAMAALRELVVSPSVSKAIGLKAALATVQFVGALDPESLGSVYAEKIETGWNRDRMFDDLI